MAVPGAWCLAPLQEIEWISDPDLDDVPPRYDKPPAGGWAAVADAVLHVYTSIQAAELDILVRTFEIDVAGKLSPDQQATVWGWFSIAEAPQWSPGNDSWLNGRHRSWGLKRLGLPFAPVLTIPVGDAILLWEPDPNGWPPLDSESLEDQREELRWWQTHSEGAPWRRANPRFGERWSSLLDHWDKRIRSEHSARD